MLRRMVVALCLLLGTVPVAVAAPLVAPAGAVGSFTAGGSVNQVYVQDLVPGAAVDLLDASSAVVRSGVADAAGSLLFREVPTGTGYGVRSGGTTVGPLTVTSPTDHPDDAWYDDQVAADPLEAGYGYLTTRDGTTLSVNVTFPVDGSPGPWPVILSYSGYDPSQPGPPFQETALYVAQGYAVAGVNMRGTGCSGGAFDFMETLQALDGYDVVETLARQPWSNGDVGMAGISYSGYSQLYVAATRPPSLDAISPLSPYSDTYSAILYPGGILNNGFAVDWATEREEAAKPAARKWARDRIEGGDTVCARNQALRLQVNPLLARIESTPFADLSYSYLNTETFVDRIEVPTYLASQWQDEQTGGSAANLVPLFDPDTKVFASFTNGAHIEPLAPADVVEVLAFIDLYVGKRKPHLSPLLAAAGPTVLADQFRAKESVADFAFPTVPFSDQPTHAAALAAWEARPRVRIKWENGAVAGKEGLPLSTTVTRHANWPFDGLQHEALYLQADGGLTPTVATVPDGVARASTAYTYDPTTKRAKTYEGGTDELWAPHPDVTWDVLAEGNSLSFASAPYAATTAYAGQGSADLWIRSSAADTDLEVTLTEVRPDGQEVFIQSGWLRASHRALDPARSTDLVPYHTHQEADAAPLPAGTFTPVRIELFPFAHVIRAGSRLRVNVEAPGGNQPFWAFDALDGTATNEIGHSRGMRSRVVLPRVPAAQTPAVPTTLPPCSLPDVTTQSVSLRNQPCRAYRPARVATGVAGAGYASSATVTWRPPAGPAPTAYRVVPSRALGSPSGMPVPAPVTVDGSTTRVTFGRLPKGYRYEFRVIALYGSTPAPASDASLPIAAGTRLPAATTSDG